MKPFPARSPVFLDSTGRRHRRIRRAGALLAIPAVGYLVLLGSSLLGGPRVDTPLIPLPEAGRQQPATRPHVTTTPVQADTPKPDETTVPTPDRSTPTPGVTTPTVAPTATPSPTPSTGKPTKSPTVAPSTPGHGKPTAAPGRTKSPTTP